MKKYLIVGYLFDDIVQTDTITKDHLIQLKQGHFKAILDLTGGTYFDTETNNWLPIKTIE